MANGEPHVDSRIVSAVSSPPERSSGKSAGQTSDDKQSSDSSKVEECDGDTEVARTHQNITFQPFYLQRSTLLAISTVFLAEVATLIALFAYSTHNGGLLPVRAALHPLWKYGPTAGPYPLRFFLRAKRDSGMAAPNKKY
jgi:hypothetical protein